MKRLLDILEDVLRPYGEMVAPLLAFAVIAALIALIGWILKAL